MTLTLEPQDGPQYVTVRATDAPVVPAYHEPLVAIQEHHEANWAEARRLFGLAPAEPSPLSGQGMSAFRAWMREHSLQTIPGAVVFLISMSVLSITTLLGLAWVCVQVWSLMTGSIAGCVA